MPSADEHEPGERERGLRLQALAQRAAEVDEQQHRERAERGERREHGVDDHLVAEREQRRHDDRRAPRPAQRREVAIALAEPLQWVHVPPSCPRSVRVAAHPPRRAAPAFVGPVAVQVEVVARGLLGIALAIAVD